MACWEENEDRGTLAGALLRQARERGTTRAEREPFWREGRWRCEFHASGGDERLKVFSGERCVHEEPVQGRAAADERSRELRRVLVQSLRAGRDDCLLE